VLQATGPRHLVSGWWDAKLSRKPVAVVNGAPRWYGLDNKPIQDSSGSFSISKGGGYSQETGTSHSWGTTLEIGVEESVSVPFVGEIGSFRASVIMDYLKTVGQTKTSETELIYGTDYTFDDMSLGHVILNVRSYTCNYYDLYPPDAPEFTSRAMICSPAQHDKVWQSLDWWLTSGKLGDFEHSWAEVGHTSPDGEHTNSLEEFRNYAGSLPFGYRVVYDWGGGDIPLICGDPYQGSVVWWAEDADGYSQGKEVSVEKMLRSVPDGLHSESVWIGPLHLVTVGVGACLQLDANGRVLRSVSPNSMMIPMIRETIARAIRSFLTFIRPGRKLWAVSPTIWSWIIT
jgi:hypothetical protein